MKYLLSFSLIVLFAGCGHQPVDLKDEEEKIVACWVDWPKKAMTGDPKLGTYYFADSAIVMGQEQPPVKGKEELIKFFSAFSKTPGLKVNWGERPNVIGFSRDGDMAYSIDTQELSMTDSTGAAQTKINQALHVWQKDSDGNWKVSLVFMYPKK